ncbi:hypothetical protein OAS39_12185 [Pirellulales bacterium]|nr:hypothetical protein [Pirellulales bacterium]
MNWRVECKISGKGHEIEGDFDLAVIEASKYCSNEWSKWVVWLLPANIRMAEVTARGAVWTRSRLSGEELRRLMRWHKMAIGALSFRMGVTQTRVREVRHKGLQDSYAVRDWLEAITGEDVGPLPERRRISRYLEEAVCGYCGHPLYVGDFAYEYLEEVFCSATCSRRSRGWGAEKESTNGKP